MESTRVILIDSLDEGMPEPKHFKIETVKVDIKLNDGEFLLQVLVMSADPYLRGSIKSTGYNKPGVMKGFVAGKILASKSANWVAGDFIGASLPYASVQVVSDEQLKATVSWKLTGYVTEENISLGVGALGMPGSTAYGGFLDVLSPKDNETIFISAASGAVGSLVGQIAKHTHKCTVIGSAGGEAKCKILTDKMKFDHSIDYKKVKDADELAKLINEKTGGKGIDMYFENVLGMHFEAAMATLRPHGRVAVCGGINEYNNKQATPVPFYPLKMIYSFQRIEGFMCHPWLSGAKGNFLKDMHKWIQEGAIHIQETFFDGVENWPLGFQSLFTGANVGKVVIRVKPSPLIT